MMRAAVLLSTLLLAACDGGLSRTGSDGYRFGAPDFDRDRIEVTLVQYDTRAAFDRAAEGYHVKYVGRLEAFTFVNTAKPICEIHIERVSLNYRPQWLGHELAHCMHGRWHV